MEPLPPVAKPTQTEGEAQGEGEDEKDEETVPDHTLPPSHNEPPNRSQAERPRRSRQTMQGTAVGDANADEVTETFWKCFSDFRKERFSDPAQTRETRSCLPELVTTFSKIPRCYRILIQTRAPKPGLEQSRAS